MWQVSSHQLFSCSPDIVPMILFGLNASPGSQRSGTSVRARSCPGPVGAAPVHKSARSPRSWRAEGPGPLFFYGIEIRRDIPGPGWLWDVHGGCPSRPPQGVTSHSASSAPPPQNPDELMELHHLGTWSSHLLDEVLA